MLKRKNKFNDEWTKEFGFISKSRKDDFHDFITTYHCDVEIGNKGKSVVYQHTAIDYISFLFSCSTLQ